MIIDSIKALELLKTVVEDKGADYVDRNASSPGGCCYVYATGGRCIIGEVLSLIGIKDDTLEELNGWGNIDRIHENHQLPSNISLPKDAIEILYVAQSAQDAGCTWGEALRKAENESKRQEVNYD